MKFEDDLTPEDIRAQWRRLQTAIEQKQPRRNIFGKLPSPCRRRYLAAAASIAFILLVSVLLLRKPADTTYATGYGEQQHIVLPDGSGVVLNSNSSLSYENDWSGRGAREVTVNGEAFFSVVHTSDDRAFLVRTPDGMQVEVLGTEFNVYERRGMQRVVLNSGSVQLGYRDGETFRLKPGEMVIKRGAGDRPEKQEVDASRYSSWKNGHLIFEDTPVSEVCRLVEDNFGLTLLLPDTVSREWLFNGTFPADSVEILLRTLMTTYNLDAVRSGSAIRLTRKQAHGDQTRPSERTRKSE